MPLSVRIVWTRYGTVLNRCSRNIDAALTLSDLESTAAEHTGSHPAAAVWRRNGMNAASSDSVRVVEGVAFDPVFKSSTVARLHNFGTVFRLISSPRLSAEAEACDRCIAARTACAVVTFGDIPVRNDFLPPQRKDRTIKPSDQTPSFVNEQPTSTSRRSKVAF